MSDNTHPLPTLLKDLGMLLPNEKATRKYRYGIYKCYCGTEFKVQCSSIKRNGTTSCGCFRKKNVTSHGLSTHPLYTMWKSMLKRCLNPKASNYHNYGGRGITVCISWLKFENFYTDMEPTFKPGLSLDRADNNLGYNPSNCRWVTRSTQSQNTRILYAHNTSGYRGVSFSTNDKKFFAQISIRNKIRRIGSFDTALDAAIAYDTYILEHSLEHTPNGVL